MEYLLGYSSGASVAPSNFKCIEITIPSRAAYYLLEMFVSHLDLTVQEIKMYEALRLMEAKTRTEIFSF